MDKVDLKKIKELRKAKGLTQENLAKTLGYRSAIGYHYLESGRCRIKADQIVVISKELGVEVKALFLSINSA